MLSICKCVFTLLPHSVTGTNRILWIYNWPGNPVCWFPTGTRPCRKQLFVSHFHRNVNTSVLWDPAWASFRVCWTCDQGQWTGLIIFWGEIWVKTTIWGEVTAVCRHCEAVPILICTQSKQKSNNDSYTTLSLDYKATAERFHYKLFGLL